MARQAGQVKSLEAALGVSVNVSPDPDLVAALGAALLGRQRYEGRASQEVAA